MFRILFTMVLLAVFAATSLRAEWQNKQFAWEKCQTSIPGVLLAEWKFNTPRLICVYALRIDLQTPGLQFHVTGKADQYGQPMPGEPGFIIRTKRQTTVAFFNEMQKKHRFPMAAAVNAAPWSPWKKPWNHPYADRMGLLVSDGDVVLPPNGKRPAFIVYKDGKVDMQILPPDADLSNIRHAVSGFFYILEKSTPSGKQQGTAPRTGIGLSADRRYLYIFVADGRQPEYSLGMTEFEVGTFLRYLGADIGINMDGGGSSTLVLRRKNKAVMLNKQLANGIRTVGASLGISIPRR